MIQQWRKPELVDFCLFSIWACVKVVGRSWKNCGDATIATITGGMKAATLESVGKSQELSIIVATVGSLSLSYSYGDSWWLYCYWMYYGCHLSCYYNHSSYSFLVTTVLPSWALPLPLFLLLWIHSTVLFFENHYCIHHCHHHHCY